MPSKGYPLQHHPPAGYRSGRCNMPCQSAPASSWCCGQCLSAPPSHTVLPSDHVVCKCHQKAIRSNTINKIPRDEWEIIENCHEAIVSREQWDRVQKLIDRRRVIFSLQHCQVVNCVPLFQPVGQPPIERLSILQSPGWFHKTVDAGKAASAYQKNASLFFQCDDPHPRAFPIHIPCSTRYSLP